MEKIEIFVSFNIVPFVPFNEIVAENHSTLYLFFAYLFLKYMAFKLGIDLFW